MKRRFFQIKQHKPFLQFVTAQMFVLIHHYSRLKTLSFKKNVNSLYIILLFYIHLAICCICNTELMNDGAGLL